MRRSRPFPVVLATTLAFATALPAQAQQTRATTPDALVGERVRVLIAPGFDHLTGTVIERDGGTLHLRQANGATHDFDPYQVQSIERSIGQRRNTRKGFFIGGAIGAAAGTVLGLVVVHALCYDDCTREGTSFTAGLAGIGGLLGGGLGAGIGATIRSDQWEPVRVRAPSATGFRVLIGPSRGLTLSASFPLSLR